jgi:hypothetical protein
VHLLVVILIITTVISPYRQEVSFGEMPFLCKYYNFPTNSKQWLCLKVGYNLLVRLICWIILVWLSVLLSILRPLCIEKVHSGVKRNWALYRQASTIFHLFSRPLTSAVVCGALFNYKLKLLLVCGRSAESHQGRSLAILLFKEEQK